MTVFPATLVPAPAFRSSSFPSSPCFRLRSSLPWPKSPQVAPLFPVAATPKRTASTDRPAESAVTTTTTTTTTSSAFAAFVGRRIFTATAFNVCAGMRPRCALAARFPATSTACPWTTSSTPMESADDAREQRSAAHHVDIIDVIDVIERVAKTQSRRQAVGNRSICILTW